MPSTGSAHVRIWLVFRRSSLSSIPTPIARSRTRSSIADSRSRPCSAMCARTTRRSAPSRMTTDEAPSFQPIEQPRDVGIAAEAWN